MLSEKTYKQILSPLISEKSAIQKKVFQILMFLKLIKMLQRRRLKKRLKKFLVSL